MSGRRQPIRPLTWGVATGALTGLAWAASRWPRMTTWGATGREITAPMSGDEIVAQARYRSTHAIDIAAPAVDVWPWLVQMGQGRGGLYSYDRIEPGLQDLAVGDVVLLAITRRRQGRKASLRAGTGTKVPGSPVLRPCTQIQRCARVVLEGRPCDAAQPSRHHCGLHGRGPP